MRVTIILTGSDKEGDQLSYRLVNGEWVDTYELEEFQGDTFTAEDAVGKVLPPPPDEVVFWQVSVNFHGSLTMEELKGWVKNEQK